MSRDTNRTRQDKNRRKALYKSAFDEVIGDPWQDREGMYSVLSNRSSISVAEGDFGMTPTTPNAAKPNVLDFFHDVETVLKELVEPELWQAFIITYVWGDIANKDSLSGLVGGNSLRNGLEQKIGRLLYARGIYPVKNYFSAQRTKRK